MRREALGSSSMPVVLLAALILFSPGTASAHCDTLDGPVVTAAKIALQRGDVTPVLRWVRPDAEPETRVAFEKTLAVRRLGPEAKDLADTYFFETLVRLHRAGEGAPFTGLEPAGEVDPAVQLADKALETGSVDPLVKSMTESVVAGIRKRFDQTLIAKMHAEESVEAGRRYVAAYVEFVHYAEELHRVAGGHGDHRGDPGEETGVSPHKR